MKGDIININNRPSNACELCIAFPPKDQGDQYYTLPKELPGHLECYVEWQIYMLSLSFLYNNVELNNQAWMGDWNSFSWLWLECPASNTVLVDWLILLCWSNKEEVTIVVFHARRVPWMLTEHCYPCVPLNVDWIYEWMATFSTFDPVISWLHVWESVVVHLIYCIILISPNFPRFSSMLEPVSQILSHISPSKPQHILRTGWFIPLQMGGVDQVPSSEHSTSAEPISS